ncbi:hypothetical protein SDD30_02940 [Moorella naiadis]|uniref:hypothetical protein n=1 Tax=Moorella naiadis (nom. illeg.) TaxID=3093670 RepID=UPI003D9C803F
MSLKYKHGGEVSDSIGLLISILVRYPEVGTINYEPHDQVLRFTFMLAQPVEEERVRAFETKFHKSLEVYNYLEDRDARVINLHHTYDDQIMSLEVQRDVATLSRDEINLIMTLVQEEFGSSLVVENNDEVMEEELILQEELIDHMLESVKGTTSERQLIAFREEGRVMVFNK